LICADNIAREGGQVVGSRTQPTARAGHGFIVVGRRGRVRRREEKKLVQEKAKS
jgi:hypothetical protein